MTCYIGRKNATTICPKDSKGNFLTINETSKSLIDNHIWNTGAIESKVTDTLSFYSDERGTKTGKICTSGDYCNDTVIRTTEWTGYVALPYVTDWAYASSESVCETNMYAGYNATASFPVEAFANMTCKKNNWMQRSSYTWYLSPSAYGSYANNAWYVSGDGAADFNRAACSYAVAPSIYLKSNVLIESGNGTSSNPYMLKTS